MSTRSATARTAARVAAKCAVALAVASGVAACSNDTAGDASKDTETTLAAPASSAASATETTTAAGAGVECPDPAGDGQAMLGLEAMDDDLASTDLTSVTVTAVGDRLEIRFRLATPAQLTAGNRTLDLDIEPVDGGYPNAMVSVTQSAGIEDQLDIVSSVEQGEFDDVATTGASVAASGDTLTVDVPSALLGPVLTQPWHWEATSAASIDGMAQDACGTTESGGGTERIYFDAPS